MGTVKDFTEADMFLPIKNFFISLDYEINAEVKNCDITLSKNGRLIIIELKKSFNLQLVFQAVERQKYCDEVYIAIPRLKKHKGSRYNDIINLVKRLDLGLIFVAMDSPLKTVEIMVLPTSYDNSVNITQNKKKRTKIEKEISSRNFEINLGGSNRKKLMTAYRENSIKLACILNEKGPLRAADLVNIYGCEKNSYNVMRSNAYGWFQRADNARFSISAAGKKALDEEEYSKIVEYYKKNI